MTDLVAVASAFLMHTGARHLQFELTDAQKALVSHPVSKVIIMYAMFYISTRNIFWSTVMLCIYFITIYILLNENHPLNVFSPGWLIAQGYVKKNSTDPAYTELYRKNLEAISR